jgi:dTDP-6-deoxy-L-talose 4-dehydrogenase (NAD+)
MKYLITGATGFVGRHILLQLLKISKPDDFTVVVRANKRACISDISNDFRIIETKDLFSESVQWWEGATEGVDIVIHCAWYVEPQKYLQSDINLNCLKGTISLAQGAINSGVKRFLALGTCFEYDLAGGYLSVNTPLNPQTVYAASKVAAFLTLEQLFLSRKVMFNWCRLFYLFGEGEDYRRLYPHIMSNLKNDQIVELTSGSQIRDFLEVSQAASQIVSVIYSNQTGPVNICSGVPITVREFAENIANKLGNKEHLLRFGARKSNFMDPSIVVGIK